MNSIAKAFRRSVRQAKTQTELDCLIRKYIKLLPPELFGKILPDVRKRRGEVSG